MWDHLVQAGALTEHRRKRSFPFKSEEKFFVLTAFHCLSAHERLRVRMTTLVDVTKINFMDKLRSLHTPAAKKRP